MDVWRPTIEAKILLYKDIQRWLKYDSIMSEAATILLYKNLRLKLS